MSTTPNYRTVPVVGKRRALPSFLLFCNGVIAGVGSPDNATLFASLASLLATLVADVKLLTTAAADATGPTRSPVTIADRNTARLAVERDIESHPRRGAAARGGLPGDLRRHRRQGGVPGEEARRARHGRLRGRPRRQLGRGGDQDQVPRARPHRRVPGEPRRRQDVAASTPSGRSCRTCSPGSRWACCGRSATGSRWRRSRWGTGATRSRSPSSRRAIRDPPSHGSARSTGRRVVCSPASCRKRCTARTSRRCPPARTTCLAATELRRRASCTSSRGACSPARWSARGTIGPTSTSAATCSSTTASSRSSRTTSAARTSSWCWTRSAACASRGWCGGRRAARPTW